MKLDKAIERVTACNSSLTSFEITKLLQEKSEELDLSATAMSVLLALIYYYNPNHEYVFPHQKTIAKQVKRSIATVKRAISELKKARFISTSKTRNGNLYAFTQKLFDTLEIASCTVEKVKYEPCIKRTEKINKKNNKQDKVVVFSSNLDSKNVEEKALENVSRTATSIASNAHNVVDFQAIPEVLRKKAERGEIRNLLAYWWKLSPQARQNYINMDQFEKEKIARKRTLQLERAKEEELKRAEEQARKEEIAKPLNEQFTKQQAIKFVYNLREIQKNTPKGIALELVQLFHLDVNKIYAMRKEEVESL